MVKYAVGKTVNAVVSRDHVGQSINPVVKRRTAHCCDRLGELFRRHTRYPVV